MAASKEGQGSCRQYGCRQSTGTDVDDLLPQGNAGGTVKERYQNCIELLQRTLDLLILQTLQWGPQHGYGISVAIRNRSGEILQVDTGSLHTALHRMEKQKWIASEWRISENKQRAKFYRLTAAGKKQLTSERSRWAQLSDALRNLESEKDLTQRTRRARSTRRRSR